MSESELSVPSAAPRRCLHIGLPKAGSTTLQQNLFARLDGIAYHALERKGGTHPEDGPLAAVIRACREGHALDLDLAALRPALSFPSSDERPAVISEERFSTHYGLSMRAKAPLLRELFGPARILLVVRHPAALMRSSYYQELRHPRYARATSRTFARWLDEAIEQRHHALSPFQLARFDWTAAAFADAFGREAIHVVPLEWISVAPDRFAAVVAGAIGVEAGLVAATLEANARPRNVRPRGLQGGPVVRERLAARRANRERRADREALGRFVAALTEPLRAFAEDYRLPLDALGYFATPGEGRR